jgi:hypothetical protein
MGFHYVQLFSKFLTKNDLSCTKKTSDYDYRYPISYITITMFHVTGMSLQHFLFVHHNLVRVLPFLCFTIKYTQTF